jgi:hypothetical protein
MANPRNATTTARGRTYRWRDESFTSVTTIIGGGVPKPALVNWAAKRVAEIAVDQQRVWTQMSKNSEKVDWLKRGPYRERDGAAVQGTAIHEWAEKRVLGLPVTVEELPAEQQPYANSFLSFVHEMGPSWEMSEATVYNREHSYAGTLDALLRLSEATVDKIVAAGGPNLSGLGLVDYKTNKSGIFAETALQLAAYRHAEFVGLPDGTEVPMPDVAWCAALWITDIGYQLVPVNAGHLAFEYFLSARMVRDFVEDVGKLLLAPAAVLPQPADRPSAPVHLSLVE